ncbi:MAG: leucine-rich repeat protein [Lachnospiraceae bacterium]|nr:leucine-rich repeat protein [Lachnospiraceae bacterium]
MKKMRRFFVVAVAVAFAVLFSGKAEIARAADCTQHVYDYACDHKCNVCEKYRVTDHNYDTVCYDANYSWKKCECGKVWDYRKHWYALETDKKCYYCGYVRELKHDFSVTGQDELYHWQVCDCGVLSEKVLHTYSGGECTVCGHKKPTWYKEEKHLTKDGAEYLSIEEAATYIREHLVARNIGMEVRYYYEIEKELQVGEAHTALFEEICKHTGKATEGDILRSTWTGSYQDEEIYDGKIHYVTVKNWVPNYASNAEQEQWLTEEIHRIFKKLKIDTMTDYEKICAIYKYICDNVSYAFEIYNPEWNNSHTDELVNAYWALKTGNAICDGYGDLVYRMMMEAGIDARTVSGTVGAHEWNIVKLDGKYYCVDATNDAGNETYLHFLTGLSEFRALAGLTHWEDPQYHTEEFWAEYPVSFTSYGKTLPQTGDVAANGVGADGMQWELSKEGILTVGGAGKIEFPYWQEWKGFIKKVVIAEGVTEIGMDAFAYCPALEEVVIPDSVTILGDRAFCYCDRLKSVSLPKGLTSVGASAFEGCNTLKEVSLPEGVEYVGEGAFRMCYNLERVVLGKKMKKIERETFWRSEKLREVVMYEGIEEIGYGAFMECTGLEKLVLPGTVKKLGDYAFQAAFSYKKNVSLIVPESVTEVGYWCFRLCNVRELIYNSPAEIVDEMFIECRCLEKLVLGEKVRKLGNRAFATCVSLKSVEWQGDLEKVGEYAFSDCKSLEKVVIPGTLKTVEKGMFYGCTGLESVVFSEGVTTICELAFAECTSLREVTIPKSITKMESVAFGWNGLEKVFFEGAPPATSGDVPLHQFFGTAYYWGNRGDWTREAMNRLANEGSVSWVDMLAPVPTEAPKPTATPAPTELPKSTATPVPTEVPKSTATPVPTETPKTTAAVSPTMKPESPESQVQEPTATPTRSPQESGDAETSAEEKEPEDNGKIIVIIIVVAMLILVGGAGTVISMMKGKNK